MPYSIGLLLGAFIGMLLVGGLAGWLVNKATKLPFPAADGVGILLVWVVSLFTNNLPQGSFPLDTAAVYGLAGVFAYLVLLPLRKRARVVPDQAATSQRLPEAPNLLTTPSFAHAPPVIARRNTAVRIIGIVLLCVLGAIGATFLFSAFKQVFAPTLYGGSPELSFLIGAALTIPCVFIHRYMIR